MTVRWVSDLLIRVRAVLQDEDQDSYRYPTSDLVGYLNDFVLEAKRFRPEVFIGTFTLDPQPISVVPMDYSTVAFPLPLSMFTAACDYVAGRAEVRDDEYAVDGRAMTFMNSSIMKLTGGA
jgi:hypothetical protein